MTNKIVFLIFTALSMILISFGLFVGGVIPMSIGHVLLILSNLAAFFAGIFVEKK